MIKNIEDNLKEKDFKRAVILLLLSPIVSFGIIEMLQKNNMFTLKIGALATNFFGYIIIYAIIFEFIKSIKYTTIIGNSIFLLIGIANHYVLKFRSKPILPFDLKSIGTAKNVAGNYKYNLMEASVIVAIIISVFIIIMAALTENYILKNTIKRNAIMLGAIFLVCSISAFIVYKTDYLKKITIWPNVWEQDVGYRENGFLTSFIDNTRYMIIEKPKNYEYTNLGKTLIENSNKESMQVMGQPKENKEKPHIIVIMDETFSDLQEISEFDTNEDYMPFIRNMKENTIRGKLLVSVFGGSTCNSEFEFLTGSSMAFMPTDSIAYTQYIKRPVDNLVTTLNDQGYTSTAIHPYYKNGWNRVQVYEDLGFHKFLTIDDFYKPVMLRSYISDKSSFDKVEEIYEENKNKGPQFIFNVTMQNHGDYNFWEDDLENIITINDMEETNQANEYLNLIKHTDNAFKGLVEYFENKKEPVIIVLFGDHMPLLYESFYEELYLKDGKIMSDLSLDDLQKKYTVPFRIWANYDIDEKDAGVVSANYLSSILLQEAGLEMTEYNSFLIKLREKVPAMNANGYLGSDGRYHLYTEQTDSTKYINDYKIYQYNHIFDEDNIQVEKYKVK